MNYCLDCKFYKKCDAAIMAAKYAPDKDTGKCPFYTNNKNIYGGN